MFLCVSKECNSEVFCVLLGLNSAVKKNNHVFCIELAYKAYPLTIFLNKENQQWKVKMELNTAPYKMGLTNKEKGTERYPGRRSSPYSPQPDMYEKAPLMATLLLPNTLLTIHPDSPYSPAPISSSHVSPFCFYSSLSIPSFVAHHSSLSYVCRSDPLDQFLLIPSLIFPPLFL